MPSRIASVVPWAASARSVSPAGMPVLPAARVMMTVCATSGTVNSTPSAAAAAKTLLTPGMMR